ncbi:hypothetical protein LL924_23340 [Xanthomonas oryzae]|nr:hypothetical protein LL924_23340 [Xanthomonas oryzae]
MPGTHGALQEGGDRAWRTELAEQIDIADTSPSSSDAVATSTVRSPALSRRSANKRVSRDRLP